MYAVFRTSGQQFRVAHGDVITVNAHLGEPGSAVEFGEVLMVKGEAEGLSVGQPVLAKAKVFAQVVEQGRGEKVLVFKKRRRKNYRRLRGHRQDQTRLRIVAISLTGDKPPAPAVEAEAAPAPVRKRAKPKKKE